MARRSRRSHVYKRVDLRTAWSHELEQASAGKTQHGDYCEGRHGWMLDSSLDAVLDPIVTGATLSDNSFYRFTHLDSQIARSLIERLPAAYLDTERQNDGPTIGTVLRAVVEHPDDLRAHGYVIGPGRCDERITVEGVLLRVDQELHFCSPYEQGPRPNCDCERLFALLQNDFGIDDARRPPHELGRWWAGVPENGNTHDDTWYRVWWD